MIRILAWLLGLIVTIVAILFAVYLGLRHHDGPMEVIRGGPFQTGELVTTNPAQDWQFLQDRMVVELQLVEPSTSRVMWLVVHDNRLFILSAFMKTKYGRVWKQWPHHAEKDNRALMRVDGKIYPRTLVRLDADAVNQTVIDEFMRKYQVELRKEDVASGATWFYELAPRDLSPGEAVPATG